MLDGAGEHVGDGFDAAVRMPGEAREVVGGPIVAEIVEQQKWICLRRVAKAEGASQFDAGALNSGLDCTMRLTGRMDMKSMPFAGQRCGEAHNGVAHSF